MLGLQRGIVKIVDHNPEWIEVFNETKKELEDKLDGSIKGIEHIGSTSIPGIKAKPILDLMISILDINAWEEIREPLEELGYIYRDNYIDDHEHILFVKGPEDSRTHYLKICQVDSNFWHEHIVFRDFLINNPKYLKEYEELKESLIKKHNGRRPPYTDGKIDFVRKVLRLAGYEGRVV